MFYITLSSTNLDQILQRRQNETFYKKNDLNMENL